MMKLVTDATNHHTKLVKEAALGKHSFLMCFSVATANTAGQGFDRHLFALKTLAKREGFDVPLFEDQCYSHMMEIVLSTSTLSSDAVLLGGFAPVSPNGYGVGYGMLEDWMGLQVYTYSTRDGKQMVDSMEQVLEDLFQVFSGKNFK